MFKKAEQVKFFKPYAYVLVQSNSIPYCSLSSHFAHKWTELKKSNCNEALFLKFHDDDIWKGKYQVDWWISDKEWRKHLKGWGKERKSFVSLHIFPEFTSFSFLQAQKHYISSLNTSCVYNHSRTVWGIRQCKRCGIRLIISPGSHDRRDKNKTGVPKEFCLF